MASKPAWKSARDLARLIAEEPATINGREFAMNGRVISTAECILRQWAMSPVPKLQLAFMEWAYGRPAEEDDTDREIKISVSYETENIRNGNPNNSTKADRKAIANLDLPF